MLMMACRLAGSWSQMVKFIVWVVLFFASCLVKAAGTLTYTLGVENYENFLPYSEYKNGEYRGLGRDILDNFARNHGISFEYIPLPLKRMDKHFFEGQLDFIFPQHPLWNPEEKKGLTIHYAPLLEFVDGLMVLKQHQDRGIKSHYALGVPLGFTPAPYLSMIAAGQVLVQEVTSYDSLYKMLLKRRIDGAYMNTRIANHYWHGNQKYQSSPIVFDHKAPYIEDYWHLASIKYPNIIQQLRLYMAENPALIRTLKNKHDFDKHEGGHPHLKGSQ